MSMKAAKLAAQRSDVECSRPRPLRRQETEWRRTTASTCLPMAAGQGCWRELGMEHKPKVLLLHGWGDDASLHVLLVAQHPLLTRLDPKPRSPGDNLLICYGRKDGIIAVQEAKNVAKKPPRSTRWLPPDTGHMGMLPPPEPAERVALFCPLSGGRRPDAFDA
ncbi:hypothetical protein [Lonsdalea iberica]|uniref:Uncharacterized protein n=1 Tax=Lonsdalea iberica TaxID=1082703 RepID=A0A1X3RR99_9GAMM|nr:hypothetical protein [Lonsdalea iberica]OSN04336.1 hypothetical protein AU511_12705 [Lonsdalea iberica]